MKHRKPADISDQDRTKGAHDPFAYHPGLRGRIADSETSFFRDFDIVTLIKDRPDLAAFGPWVHTDAQREALRAKVLAGHKGDLWIFAYGSLMWDPALRFKLVRRAFAPDFARRFILMDDKGARGTSAAPGLMAALDHGSGCEGLAFLIEGDDVDRETEILFRREMVGPGYLAQFVPIEIDGEQHPALSFLADPTSPDIRADITRAEQIRCIATGAGFLGTSRDYLAGIVEQFGHLGIKDKVCLALLREVDAFIAENRPEVTQE